MRERETRKYFKRTACELAMFYEADGPSGGFEPFVSGGEEFLDNAMDWALKHELNVIIDLHGAPGW